MRRWQPDNEVSRCPVCQSRFGWLNRRHHCRRCGRVVCGECLEHMLLYPNPVQIRPDPAPFRTCDECADVPAQPPASSAALPRPVMKDDTRARVEDEGELEPTCVVCGVLLAAMSEPEAETHVNDCLVQITLLPDGRRDSSRNHLLVYVIPDVEPDDVGTEHANTSDSTSEKPEFLECIICLEDMVPGDKVGRLEYCLCVFHYHCIKDWFNRKKWGECPTHHTYNYAG